MVTEDKSEAVFREEEKVMFPQAVGGRFTFGLRHRPSKRDGLKRNTRRPATRRCRLKWLEQRRVLSITAPGEPDLDTAATTAGQLDAIESTTASALSPLAIAETPMSGDTGEAVQSKVWFHEGIWWSAVAQASGTWLQRLDGLEWTPVLQLTPEAYRADIVTRGDLTHILLEKANASKLVSLEYHEQTEPTYVSWQLRSQAVDLPLDRKAATATLAIDSQRRMWVASDTRDEIVVHYADAPYSNWSGPIVLASGVHNDDVASIMAIPGPFPGLDSIAVMWSDQQARQFGFRLLADGADPETGWSPDETPGANFDLNLGGGIAHDQFNVAVAADGSLYAAVRTNYSTAGETQIGLMARDPQGAWEGMYQIDTAGSEPFVLLREIDGVQNGLLVAYRDTDAAGPIVYRQTQLPSISFGEETVLIDGDAFSNPSGTKQSFAGQAVVIASDGTVLAGALLADDANVNFPPVLASIDPQLVSEETTLSFTVSATDPNQHTVTYSADNMPQADPLQPVGINPKGAIKDGHVIDGALPEEMRRSGPFTWPPNYTNYVWEGLQGAIVQAEILHRAEYDTWEWEDRALLRAFDFLYDLGFDAVGDDEWQPFLADARHQTNFAVNPRATAGKIMGWTAWTHTLNEPPVALDDIAITQEDVPVTIDVLANDADADGDPLVVDATTLASHGTLNVNLDQTITYTPNANYHGDDSFTYTIGDGDGGAATATVFVTVDPVNDAPVVAQPLADVRVTAGTLQTVLDLALVFDDADVLTDGDLLTLWVTDNTDPLLVTASLDGTTLTLTYAPNLTGSANITVTAADQQGATAQSTFMVTVLPSAVITLSSSEATAHGTVTENDLTATWAEDDVYEVLQEESYARNKRSRLEHTWTFDVTGGPTVTFFLEAYRDNLAEDFLFEYSIDWTTWIPMLTVTKTADDDQPQSYDLPSGTSGTIFVRVIDTNRSNREPTRDVIYIDDMYILSE